MNKFFISKKSLIQKEISEVIKLQRQYAKSEYPWSNDALNRLENFTVSGKMIRGLLVVLATGNKSKQAQSDAIKIGAALELMHSGILVHDDIMDRDLLRRGKPTIHAQYTALSKLPSKSESVHYGEGMASCVGILAYFMAMSEFGKVKTNKGLAKLVELFSLEMGLLGLGQMDDLNTGTMSASSEKDCLRIYEQKTGRYTFGLPILAGLILAGKHTKSVEVKVQQLAKSLGIIFQLRDDYLGVFGDTVKTGKSVGGDIRERKKTWLYFRLLKKVNKSDAKKISTLFNSHNVMTKSQQAFVISKMKEVRIPELAERELQAQQKNVLTLLKKLPFDKDQLVVMEDLINYLAVREK